MTETKFKTTRSEASTGFCDIEKVNITVFRLFYKFEKSNEEHVFEYIFHTQSCYSYMRMFTLLELKKYLQSQNLPKWR